MADQVSTNPERPKALGYRMLGTGAGGKTKCFIIVGILPKDDDLSRRLSHLLRIDKSNCKHAKHACNYSPTQMDLMIC